MYVDNAEVFQYSLFYCALGWEKIIELAGITLNLKVLQMKTNS